MVMCHEAHMNAALRSRSCKVHVSVEKCIFAPRAQSHSAPALSCSEPLQVAHYLSPTLVKFNSTLLKSLPVHWKLAETGASHKDPPATADLGKNHPAAEVRGSSGQHGAQIVQPPFT